MTNRNRNSRLEYIRLIVQRVKDIKPQPKHIIDKPNNNMIIDNIYQYTEHD